MAVLKSLFVGIFAVSVCAAQSIDISGQITDTGGTPLPGAIVTLVNAGLTATTGANGSFALTSTSVGGRRGQNNRLPTQGLSAGIYNGVLYVNLLEKSDVDITTFSLQGKAVSTLKRTMDVGTNSLPLPRIGAGVYLHKLKAGSSEFTIKGHFVDGIFHGTAKSFQSPSSDAVAKRAKSATAFNDAVLVTKDGYLSYRMMITNSDTSGIEIKMMAGTGLVIVGLQRMIVMKDIPAGTFTMGSDSAADDSASPAHQVTLSAFKMLETDVTQEQYLAVMGTNPSHFDTGTGASLRPVEMVSWYDAVQYCNALSAISGLTPVYDTSTWTADFSKTGYRLPTEAQWEYACRAGSTTAYWWGPDTNGLGANAWWENNSNGTTQPVATKPANSFGLYDISGNVWQWCNDWYGVYTAGEATDPTGAATGTYRVERGGSWHDGNGAYFRSTDRAYSDLPDFRNNDNGFRVVLPR